MLPIFIAGVFPDLWQGYIQGVIKALAIQDDVITINLIGYWLLQLPFSFLFVFYLDYGFGGLWGAMVICQVFIVICFTRIVFKTDWE